MQPLVNMPYRTEGLTASNPWTPIVPHLLGKRGPSGFGSSSTAEEVSKDWHGEGKVRHELFLASETAMKQVLCAA